MYRTWCSDAGCQRGRHGNVSRWRHATWRRCHGNSYNTPDRCFLHTILPIYTHVSDVCNFCHLYGSHRQHAVHRCGPNVTRSMVCVCWARVYCAKMDEPIEMPFGEAYSCGSKEPRTRWGYRYPKGALLRGFLPNVKKRDFFNCVSHVVRYCTLFACSEWLKKQTVSLWA